MWEVVSDLVKDGDSCRTSRLRVPGGWIVKTIFYFSDGSGIAQTFLPDPNYKWKLDKK